MSRGGERFNPFPGLRPFQIREKYLFFGREEQTAELVSELKSTRFLTVVGTSGSGKSSLVIAGLLPELHGGLAVDSGADWEVAVMRPGGSPLTNLAEALVAADLYDIGEAEVVMQVRATLSRSGLGLVEAARQSDLGEGANLVLVVDQFEELFRFRRSGADEGGEAGAFVRLLLEATQQSEVPIYVVLTMRSDYLGDCAEFADLSEAVAAGVYLIPRLGREQVRRAIMGPVKVGGGEMAPRLLQKLLNDVGDTADYLPQLQHALMRTWERWLEEGGEGGMDLRHYEAVGGMAEALSRHAEEVYAALGSDEERRVAGRMFKALTENGGEGRGVRQPLALKRLRAIVDCEAELLVGVIEAFRGVGRTFLMPQAGVPLRPWTVVDLSHESLMRVWRRLVGWLVEEAESAQIFRRLRDTARLHARGVAGLLRHPELKVAEDWLAREGPNGTWAEQYGGDYALAVEFLRMSSVAARAEEVEKRRRERQKLEQAEALAETQRQAARVFKRFAVALACGLVVALAVSVVAVGLRQKAVEAEGRANVASGELVEQLVRADLGAAVEKWEAGEGEASLSHLARALRTKPDAGVAAARGFGSLATGQMPMRWRDGIEAEKPFSDMDYNREADALLTWGEGHVVVWDPGTGERRVEIGKGRFADWYSWSSDRKRVIARTFDDRRLEAWHLEDGLAAGIGLDLPSRVGSGEPWREAMRLVPASGSEDVVVTEYRDGGLQVWSVTTGTAMSPELGAGMDLIDWCLSEDGERLCGLYQGGVLGVWEVDGGGLVETIELDGWSGADRLLAGPGGILAVMKRGGGARLWCAWAGDAGAGGRRWIEPDFDVGGVGFVETEDGRPVLVAHNLPGGNTLLVRRPFRSLVIEPATSTAIETIHSGGNAVTILPRLGERGNRFIAPVFVVVSLEHVGVFDMRTGAGLTQMARPERMDGGEISSDGSKLLLWKNPVEAGQVRGETSWLVCDLKAGSLMFPDMVREPGRAWMQFGGDGETVYSAAEGARGLTARDARTGKLRMMTVPVRAEVMAEGVGGRWLAILEGARRMEGDRRVTRTRGVVEMAEMGQPPIVFEDLIWNPTGSPAKAGYTPDGRLMFGVGSGDVAGEVVVRVWETQGRVLKWEERLGEMSGVFASAVSADGRHLAIGCGSGRLVVFDFESGEVSASFDSGSLVEGCAFSPDGELLASSMKDGRAAVWDLGSGEAVVEPRLYSAGELKRITFSADGESLAVFAYPGELNLVNPMTGEHRVERIKLATDVIRGEFSRDGRFIVPAVGQASIPVIEVATGEVAGELVHDDIVRAVAFSADGGVLATGGGESRAVLTGFVTLWDWRGGRRPMGRFDPGGTVARLAFSNDGRLLATGTHVDGAGAVQVWHVETRQPLGDPVVERGYVHSLEFRHDGRELVASWGHGIAKVIPVAPCDDAPPAWVAEMFDGVAGQRLGSRGAGEEEVSRSVVGDLRERLAREGENGELDGYELWARWLLAPPAERTIEPTSRVKVEDRVEQLRGRGRLEALGEALMLVPDDPLTHQALGEREMALAREAEFASSAEMHRIAARWHSDRSVALGADDATIWEKRAVLMGEFGHRAGVREAEAALRWLGGGDGGADGLNAGWAAAVAAGRRGEWAEGGQLVGGVIRDLGGYAPAAGIPGRLTAALNPVVERLRALGVAGTSGIQRAGLLTAAAGEQVGFRLVADVSAGGGVWRLLGCGEENARRLSRVVDGERLVGARLLVELALATAGGEPGVQAAAARFFAVVGEQARARALLDQLCVGNRTVAERGREWTASVGSVLLAMAQGQRVVENAGVARLYSELASGLLAGHFGDAFVEPVAARWWSGLGDAEVRPLFPKGSRWRYLDVAQAAASDWPRVGFDDSTWMVGRGPLGYGEDGEVTKLDGGSDPSNRHRTAYFRTEFEVSAADLEGLEGVRISVRRDDGVVVYLNGKEVLRGNMPAGEIGYETFAVDVVSRENERRYFDFLIDGVPLVEGSNVIAAEVHQSTRGSSDLGFDLTLDGVLELGSGAPDEDVDLEAAEERLGVPAILRGLRAVVE